MLDFVQMVSDRVGRLVGIDDETMHWVGVAVRESVINAIKHGNRIDAQAGVRRVHPPTPDPTELEVRVRDQGDGFDPDGSPTPWRRRTC